jgi:TldD protein
LQNTATGLAGAALAGSIVGCEPYQASNPMLTGHSQLADYYTLFGVDEDIIRRTISEGMSCGGDYCDLFFQRHVANRIGLEDHQINNLSSNVDFGVGIRVLKGDRTGYSFTEELTPEAMKQAARTAASIANSAAKPGPVEFKLHQCKDYYPVQTPWQEVGVDQKIPHLQQLNDKAYSLDKRIVKCHVSLWNDWTQILIADSNGRIAFDYRPMASMYLSCVAEQGGKRESNRAVFAGRFGAEIFSREETHELARTAVRRTVELFDAVKPEGGQMPVVLAPGKSGILLHEAIGHGMEADFNRKKESTFSDKMGKKVAKPFVSIVDDGTVANARGSINIDDEGCDSRKTYMVRNGVLESYLHDRISAAHYGVDPTGNGRRQSFRYMPQPRMRCTYMENGPHKRDEIIKSVKRGLYAEHFSNGEVEIGSGDFSFYVKSGRLIEDGKLTRPVKDINIIGNGPQVLKDIVMVADDFKEATLKGGTCGKGGQWVPVSMGLPTVKVSKITVGSV